MEIATTVRECLTNFKALLDHEENQNVEDEYGRFRTWVGNISAHRTGRRSLEYRLRDSSNLQATVTSLLKDLLAVLEQLQGLLRPERLEGPEGDRTSSLQQEDLASNDVDDEDADLFGLDEEESSPRALFEHTLDEAHEVITCLLRFSMTLRNPARHDQLKQAAATTTKHFEPHDINHVREKFPTAPSYLHTRLGKAIAKQRQYFKYREEHHLKLAEGLDDAQDGQEERPSTIATSLKLSEDIAPQASTIDLEGETESVYTATSFAPTTAGDASLKPPPLPEAGRDGDPFECPLCYGIIVAEDQRSWRQHVYEDLPPYVCTFENCVSADHRYSRRRDWQRHQAKFHNRHWLCPFGCAGKIVSEADFHKHLAKNHDQNLDTAAVQRMADACAITEEPSDLSCPLCKDVMPSTKRLHKHLGHHLEQFALHALPQHVLGEGSDEEDAEIVDDSDEEGVSANDGLEPADSDPNPDARKAPIKFKDIIGRKYEFPFYRCKTWKGMEDLIRNVFFNGDRLEQHVRLGHFDLEDPDGILILPKAWDTEIQPGWQITMRMWPAPDMDEAIGSFSNKVFPHDLPVGDQLAETSAEQGQSVAPVMKIKERLDNYTSVHRRDWHSSIAEDNFSSDDEDDSLAGSKPAANAPRAFAMDEREEAAAAQAARDFQTSSSAQEDNESSRPVGENQTPDDSQQPTERLDESNHNAQQQLSEAQMNEIIQSETQEMPKNGEYIPWQTCSSCKRSVLATRLAKHLELCTGGSGRVASRDAMAKMGSTPAGSQEGQEAGEDDKEVEQHHEPMYESRGDGDARELSSDESPYDKVQATENYDGQSSPPEMRTETPPLSPQTMPGSDHASSSGPGLWTDSEPISKDVQESVKESREKAARQALEQDPSFKPLTVGDAFEELVRSDQASTEDWEEAHRAVLEAADRQGIRGRRFFERETEPLEEGNETSRPTWQPRWDTLSEKSSTTDIKGPEMPNQPLGEHETPFDRNAPDVSSPQPVKAGQSRALDAESTDIRSEKSSALGIVRPINNTEEWSVYHFEQHARQCNHCFAPMRVSREGRQLCATGHALAQDVAEHLTYSQGEICSTHREKNQFVQVKVKQEYAHALGLLRSIDYHVSRSSRSSRQQPIVTYGSSQAGGYNRSDAQVIEPERRPRNETIIVEPAESGKSTRSRRYHRSSGYETVVINEDCATTTRGESSIVVEVPQRERSKRYHDAPEFEVADSKPGREKRYHVEFQDPPRRTVERRERRERRESF